VEVDTRTRLITLMRDLVIIEPDGPKRVWSLDDGLVLHVHPSFSKSPQRGTVIGVGPKVRDLFVGDRILYGRTSWVAMLDLTYEVRGPVGLIFHERDILAQIVSDDADSLSE
jgi:hypothetical protein